MSAKIFSTYLQRNLPGTPLAVVSQDAEIYTKIRPQIKLTHTKTCMPTANSFSIVADTSLFLRCCPDGISMIFGKALNIGGGPAVGLPTILFFVMGLGMAFDSLKQMRACEKLGDVKGANLARVQIAENIFVALGAAALAVVRVFGVIQEYFQVLKQPLVLSSAMVALKTAATYLSTALFVVYYTLFALRQVDVLRDLSKGNALRETLLKSSDSVETLRKIIDEKMCHGVGSYTGNQLTKIALEEGARWLEKLEKEVKDVPWERNLKSRLQHVRRLFLNHPLFMMGEMGMPVGFDTMSPEGRLVRFGLFIAEKRLAAKIESDLKRLLGTEAVEAIDNPEAFRKALKSVEWSAWGIRWKTVLKMSLAVIGAAAIIAGTIFSGGLALAIPLLVLGVTGIVWIFLSDGAAFKSQWESGEVRKRDRFLIYLSCALSIAALGVLLSFTVLSGGAPLYIAGIVFALAWIVINGRSAYDLIQHQRKPCEYQKQPTIEAFRKFLETHPSEEKIEKIRNKLSQEDQEGLRQERDIRKAAEAWEKKQHELKKRSLAILMDNLRAS